MRIVLLKSGDFGAWAAMNGGALPYRFDLRRQNGVDLVFTDRHLHGFFARRWVAAAVAFVERIFVPFLQTVLVWPALRTADGVVAMFESEAHFLGLLRWLRVPFARRPRFVVVSCWLTSLLETASPRKLAWYRRIYSTVDEVIVLSSLQVAPTLRGLALAPSQVRFVRFGVDIDAFDPSGTTDGGYVLAVGRDRSRDWPTLLEAARRVDLPFKVLARTRDVEALAFPGNVEFLGYRPFAEYRSLLLGATVVVVAVAPRSYPTGQTVMLEAMAAAKPVVVTATPALADYLDGANAVTVDVADPAALATSITELYGDEARREAVGRAGRAYVERHASAEHLWDAVFESFDRMSR